MSENEAKKMPEKYRFASSHTKFITAKNTEIIMFIEIIKILRLRLVQVLSLDNGLLTASTGAMQITRIAEIIAIAEYAKQFHAIAIEVMAPTRNIPEVTKKHPP